MQLFALFSLLALASVSPTSEEFTLNVTCSGLSGDEGSVILSVYNSEEGFPDEPYMYASIPVIQGQREASISLSGLPAGSYAATLLHDTDGDERMDSNLIGIPREGFSFSNNAKPGILGAPSFSKCRFTVSGDVSFEMKMMYI